MSTRDDIKKLKRQQSNVTAAESMFEFKPLSKDMDTSVKRRRVSFDLREDIHKSLKMKSIENDKKMYMIIEEALDQYLKE